MHQEPSKINSNHSARLHQSATTHVAACPLKNPLAVTAEGLSVNGLQLNGLLPVDEGDH